jgi:hypothetical protein
MDTLRIRLGVVMRCRRKTGKRSRTKGGGRGKAQRKGKILHSLVVAGDHEQKEQQFMKVYSGDG